MLLDKVISLRKYLGASLGLRIAEGVSILIIGVYLVNSLPLTPTISSKLPPLPVGAGLCAFLFFMLMTANEVIMILFVMKFGKLKNLAQVGTLAFSTVQTISSLGIIGLFAGGKMIMNIILIVQTGNLVHKTKNDAPYGDTGDFWRRFMTHNQDPNLNPDHDQNSASRPTQIQKQEQH